MDIRLDGKHALVCGSTQGIGRAAAVELASLGVRVVLCARNEEALERVRQTLPSEANQAHTYVVADFTDPEHVQSRVAAWTRDNPVHILVNNTGGPPGGLAIEADAAEFLTAFRNHLICNQLLAQVVVPGMQQATYGRIINVISTSVKQPIPGLGVSNTIRGAVASWAKTLANELGGYGITVNNVLPGFTQTTRLMSIIQDKAQKSGTTEEAVIDAMQASIPAGRFADAAEVGSAIAFLASPAAAYINGINLPVDGGRTSCL